MPVVPNYIEEVFSTYLYAGNSASRSINNAIDLSTNGGLVWIKNRSDASYYHKLTDTARGANQALSSNTTGAQQDDSPDGLTAFNTNGFSLGTYSAYNVTGNNYASWTFRKQPKFFDVVTYTGDGTANRQISHALGSTSGIKKEGSEEGETLGDESTTASKVS